MTTEELLQDILEHLQMWRTEWRDAIGLSGGPEPNPTEETPPETP